MSDVDMIFPRLRPSRLPKTLEEFQQSFVDEPWEPLTDEEHDNPGDVIAHIARRRNARARRNNPNDELLGNPQV